MQSKDERDLLKDLMKRFNEIHLGNTLHRSEGVGNTQNVNSSQCFSEFVTLVTSTKKCI